MLPMESMMLPESIALAYSLGPEGMLSRDREGSSDIIAYLSADDRAGTMSPGMVTEYNPACC